MMLDIERPLRRKFRSEKNVPTWLLIILILIDLTLACYAVSQYVDAQAHAAEVSRQSTYSTLCAQYKADSSLVGTAAEATLKDVCN